MAGAVRRFAVAVAVSLAVTTAAWAQESNQDLKKEVDELKKKVAALETETPKATSPVLISADAKVSENLMDDLNKWIKDTKLSGFVDSGYTFNVEHPNDQKNRFRCFDTNANSFMLDNAQIMLEKTANDKSIAGFRFKLSTGSDAGVLSATDGISGGPSFNLTEGYVEVLAPLGKGLDIKLGKFVTNAGYEVIEAKDDFNYSRSLLFTWAIPFNHTGIRASYQLLDMLNVGIGVNNGWDDIEDNNYAKTFEYTWTLKPIDWFTFGGTFLVGADRGNGTPITVANTGAVSRPGAPGDKRYLVDMTATATHGDWTVGANFDYGRDHDALTPASGGKDSAVWIGEAGYVKWQVVPWDAPSIRVEAFRDSDGFRTSNRQTLMDITLTNEFDINDNLVVRVEFRHDHSSEKAAFLKDGDPKKNNDTLAFEAIFKF